MAIEIERRYLVNGFQETTRSMSILQGYLSLDPSRIVRVRLCGNVGKDYTEAYITIKGQKYSEGSGLAASCPEYEYEIPVDDAKKMLPMCLPSLIEKTRYFEDFAGKRWEIDVFQGDNDGLVIAEIELEKHDERYEIPPWASTEITEDKRFANASLTKLPYSKWDDLVV